MKSMENEQTPDGASGMPERWKLVATLAQRIRLRLMAGAVVEPVSRLTLRPGDALPMTVHRGG